MGKDSPWNPMLGTTMIQVVAVMEGGQPTVIPNQEGTGHAVGVAFTKGGNGWLGGQVASGPAITNPGEYHFLD